MAATDVDEGGGIGGVLALQIDKAYEFCAPKFFDFLNDESEEDIGHAELWFETALSYAPSPFMPRIKVGRTVQLDSLCDFGNVEQNPKDSEPAEASNKKGEEISSLDDTSGTNPIRHAEEVVPMEVKEHHNQERMDAKSSIEFVTEGNPCEAGECLPQEKRLVEMSTSLEPMGSLNAKISSFMLPVLPPSKEEKIPAKSTCTPKAQELHVKEIAPMTDLRHQKAAEACTPKALRMPLKDASRNSLRNQTAKKPVSQIRQPFALKPKNQSSAIQSTKSVKPKSLIGCPGSIASKNTTTDIAQEHQAIKRQKLDGGRSRQILNVKNQVLPHKSNREERHNASIRKEATPFVSAAEMVKKFQSHTRDIEISLNTSLSHADTASSIQRRPKLALTRPKEPELETANRVRAVRVKSSAELEEEMLARIPKFKARPINKKILEAPSLPALPRSAPQPPEFQEFHLKTMERANQHAETSSAVSSTFDLSSQNQGKPHKLTEPRPPHLETSLRARPPRAKSTQELELEELEKFPQFKARPLNKKIFESKGDLGLFCNQKRQVTTPKEFHFATDERIGSSAATVEDLFDKLSLHSKSSLHDQKELPRMTIPNPFHLHTEERGLEKERQFSVQVLQKQLEEERARIPRANPYPYTTDYPVIPPKPEPKQCTKPEAFQLESLIRHEEEMQRKLEEKETMEKEEAQKRIFRAQPVIKEDPLPLPERERKPLTEVQEFVLHIDHRAVHRSEFDKKIKEKEMMYKRLREEDECAKQIEEEKAVKQMRRTMVPHARPIPTFDNPFLPQKSMKEPTKPKSPKLRVTRREERRHASHMR